MAAKDELFNLDLHILDEKEIRDKNIGKITTGSIFEPSSNNFSKEGLFSTEIFGPIGSSLRNERFGYIDLKLPIFHPIVFKQLVALRRVYKEILAGTKRAKWSAKDKDFVIVGDEEGETGFTFFCKHVTKLDFEKTESLLRNSRLMITSKFVKPENMLRYFLVLPAGLRDYTVNKQGQPSEDEINNLYRRLLMTSNMITNTNLKEESIQMLDPIRYRMQMNAQAIYEYIMNLLGSNDGKNKFIQGKWAKRGVINGTRNVLTPSPINIPDLDSPNKIGVNDTVIGLFQYLKAITPLTIFHVHREFINNIINPNDDRLLLVDPKTMKSDYFQVSVKKRDDWLTNDGLESTINKLAQYSVREEAVKIDGKYLMLVYDTGDTITCIKHTDDITDDMKKELIRPITYGELFYISIYDIRNKYPGVFTRYPVIEEGSIYPSYTYVKTTAVGRTVTLKKDGVEKTLYEYIKFGEEWVESLSCSLVHLAKLGGDFDGDKCSYTILYSDEAVAEINKVLSDTSYYLTNGKITYSSDINTSNLVFKHMSTGV